MLVFGTRHYGPVDRIEGVGRVLTRFIHIWFVPLVPIGSTFVVRETDDGVQGIDVGLNLRSVLVAWTRTACVVGGFGALSLGLLSGLTTAIDGGKAGQKLLQKGPKGVTYAEAFDVAGSLGFTVGAFVALLAAGLVFWGVGRLFRDATGARRAELMGRLGIAPGLDAPAPL